VGGPITWKEEYVMKYSEVTLKGWCKPASESEDEKINHSIDMIKDAICHNTDTQNLDIEIFTQGSYANNTNVRSSSDVDVCIMLRSTFFTHYPDGMTDADFGFSAGGIAYEEYKKYALKALIDKFGKDQISVGNKSIKIHSNTYHVEADAVVAFMLRDYYAINSRDPNKFVEGIRFYAKDGSMVSNYPKEHIKNGTAKNNATNHAYKKLVRIFKRIRNEMADDKVIDGDKITSFLVESLIWNVPNWIITSYSSWGETVKQAIIFLYNAIDAKNHLEWGEVSERLYLFRGGRKWSDTDAKSFLKIAQVYLELA